MLPERPFLGLENALCGVKTWKGPRHLELSAWMRRLQRGRDVGALIMLGTLFALIALVYWVVLRYDPEAHR